MKIKFLFYDTAGQETYIPLLPKNYIRDSHIVLLVYSDIETFETLKKRWYKFYADNANIEKTKFIVVANKSDNFGVNKSKIKDLGKQFGEEIDAFFITCSAKSEENIDKLENHIIAEAKRLIDDKEKEKENTKKEENNTLKSTIVTEEKQLIYNSKVTKFKIQEEINNSITGNKGCC